MSSHKAEAIDQHQPVSADVDGLATARDAGGRIAPTWPLDQLIAVNPWWEMRGEPLADVSARLSVLSQTRCLMPRDHYRELWQSVISERHLESAAAETGASHGTEGLLAWLNGSETLSHWHHFSDQVDNTRNLARQVSWHDEIVFQISQFCASYFSEDTPMRSASHQGLYASWLDSIRHDRGIAIMMGEPGLNAQFAALPSSHEALIPLAVAELDLPADAVQDYFHALLLEVNGWASWVAYQRWQSRLSGGDEDQLPQLLGIRLAWELALWRHQGERHADTVAQTRGQWRRQFAQLPEVIGQHREVQRPAWIWQRAAELAYQESLAEKFASSTRAAAIVTPVLQAAFCIDVRSEVYRRALEAQNPQIQTLGFAGFFGLPLAYSPAGSTYERPQLPGLLSPSITVTEDTGGDNTALQKHSAQLNRSARWQAFGKAAPASFGYIESTGIAFAFKLLRESFLGGEPRHPVNTGWDSMPLAMEQNGQRLTTEDAAALAAGILGAMTLTENFAPIVMLVGHGSSTRNNAHAASLDCGACGGQTGEINVRALAQVLNDPAVRKALLNEGIAVPDETQFIPALHDTTTDDIRCFGAVPQSFKPVESWLHAASEQARRERAGKLGSHAEQSTPAIRKRSRDWSQVRPEWGLANNACFVVAPRARTRHLDLEGRSFLHDYIWEPDAQQGYPVLELIMTAPMIVTHWINMQYNASVTDNLHYGSGNKVLHNVVGGNLGVFEGNSGDLRIGLPLQSLHDGKQWMHQPLRLSVYLAAPREAIKSIVDKHEVVRELIDNDWLYLFQLDDDSNQVVRLYQGEWLLPQHAIA